jgi:signal transduction histidine kinase
VVRRIQSAVDNVARKTDSLDLEPLKEQLRKGVSWMAHSGLYQGIVVVGADGDVWVGDQHARLSKDLGDCKAVLASGKTTTTVDAERRLLTIAAPIYDRDQCIAAARVPVRIDAVREGLRQTRLLVWFYLGLNVLVLVVFGNFLLSRIVIKPIKRLVKMADHFEESDLLSIRVKSEKNEIAHLTMALNRMVKRLSEHKERLEAHIRSLETANLALTQAKEEVLRSEKLSSLGRLAAGVAHEVGNPMGAVLGYTNLLMEHVTDDEKARDYLQRIETEVRRIDGIVRELLDFSRPKPSEPAPVDVNSLVSESASFLSYKKLMASIQVETRLEDGIGMVWADADQLKQVLVNLMLNAVDAIEGKGVLEIATRGPLPEKEETASEGSSRGFVEIAVSDTGKGISTEDVNKIFDPFYTTKPPGEGTGLGLAISLRIVEAFGGTIHVESTEGEGSTFSVQLPPYEAEDDTE